MKFSLTGLGFAFLLGILCQDLAFDYGVDLNTKDGMNTLLSYYTHFERMPLQCSLIIPGAMGLVFVYLLYQITVRKNIWDILTFITGITGLYYFVFRILPIRASLATMQNDALQMAGLQEISYIHFFILLPIIFLCLGLQALSAKEFAFFQSKKASTIETTTSNNKRRSSSKKKSY